MSKHISSICSHPPKNYPARDIRQKRVLMETAEPRCVSVGNVGGCDGTVFFSHFVHALRAGGYGKGSGTCKFNIGLSEQAVVSFCQVVLWDHNVDFTA